MIRSEYTGDGEVRGVKIRWSVQADKSNSVTKKRLHSIVRPRDAAMRIIRRLAEVGDPDQPETPQIDLARMSSDTTQRALHELQVHQIELEMQNDALLRSQIEAADSRANYVDLYDLAPVGYLSLSEAGVILNANLTAAVLLAVARESLVGEYLTRFIFPMDQDVFYRHRKTLLVNTAPAVIQLRMIKHGQINPFWVRMEAIAVEDKEGVTVCRVVLSDITELKFQENRQRQATAILESAREGIMVTDADAHILLVNQAFSDLTGYDAHEVMGQTPHFLESGRHNPNFFKAMWTDIQATGYWQGEIWNRRKAGEVFPQLLSISALRDEEGRVIQYVGVFSDISQIKDASVRLDYLAHHDALTGLPNRLLLFSRLEHCIGVSRRDRKSAALLMLDLDRFKDVNDSFGHLAGDELLQQVAARLTARLRGVDTVTRLGGDEFAVLLEDLSHPEDAAHVADEIIEALAEPWRLTQGIEVRIGVSIGISLFPEHGNSSEELLQQADAALYRAKGEGRGNFKYYSDELTFAALRRIKTESLLRRALVNDELRIHYQPQIDISSGLIVGAEALVRWQSPGDGLMSPDDFIPIAEETGLIASIGDWVLRETCLQGQRWIADGLPPLTLAVNLSLHQFRHGDIGESVATILRETGFPPERLVLEITESTLMEREGEAIVILKRLRALGLHLAIDDFGTGYSSLAHLKFFPLDALKIDKSFIEDIPQQQQDREITSAIIGLAHTLHLKVLAEGVETSEQLDFLSEQGCDGYQGYFNSPALPAIAFEAFLQSEPARRCTL